jgi:hypothetical protein
MASEIRRSFVHQCCIGIQMHLCRLVTFPHSLTRSAILLVLYNMKRTILTKKTYDYHYERKNSVVRESCACSPKLTSSDVMLVLARRACDFVMFAKP